MYIKYTYDEFGRATNKTFVTAGGNVVYNQSYDYTSRTSGGKTYESYQVSSHTNTLTASGSNTPIYEKTLYYEYDSVGNITGIKESATGSQYLYRYEYDDLGQLTKETDYSTRMAYGFVYDGNHCGSEADD